MMKTQFGGSEYVSVMGFWSKPIVFK